MSRRHQLAEHLSVRFYLLGSLLNEFRSSISQKKVVELRIQIWETCIMLYVYLWCVDTARHVGNTLFRLASFLALVIIQINSDTQQEYGLSSLKFSAKIAAQIRNRDVSPWQHRKRPGNWARTKPQLSSERCTFLTQSVAIICLAPFNSGVWCGRYRCVYRPRPGSSTIHWIYLLSIVLSSVHIGAISSGISNVSDTTVMRKCVNASNVCWLCEGQLGRYYVVCVCESRTHNLSQSLIKYEGEWMKVIICLYSFLNTHSLLLPSCIRGCGNVFASICNCRSFILYLRLPLLRQKWNEVYVVRKSKESNKKYQQNQVNNNRKEIIQWFVFFLLLRSTWSLFLLCVTLLRWHVVSSLTIGISFAFFPLVRNTIRSILWRICACRVYDGTQFRVIGDNVDDSMRIQNAMNTMKLNRSSSNNNNNSRRPTRAIALNE